ncbi:ribonuclease T2-like [Hemicordylus capensis]|uniref:ribonuclease T2-like n=1 Tax=Hemicordylus capensis TaxID=884348 RepID=UPI0023035CED|nr:ribonuclease T2-like [Hemicordylus capensis]
MMMVKLAALVFLGMGAFTLLVRAEKLWTQVEMEHAWSCPWKCIVFVQMWPGSFCVALGKRFECVMPKNASNWTIHGLWPSKLMDCCHYWSLFPSDLADLETELSLHWPTFINMTNFYFWAKEWQKHGTCAGCVEMLNSPNKYFKAALFLRTKYNVDRAFQRASIAPTCKHSYQLNTFVATLHPILGDQFELQCVTDVQGRQILVQIKVSLYSNFSSGCFTGPYNISPYKPCKPQSGVFYFPPSPENPRNPCP